MLKKLIAGVLVVGACYGSARFLDTEYRGLVTQLDAATARIDSLEARLEAERYAKVRLSAYSARQCETDATPYTTACQRRVGPGQVAVSRDLFEQGWVFDRKVYIYGIGVYTISDLMAPRIEGPAIDVFHGSTAQAYRFGVKEDVMAVLLD